MKQLDKKIVNIGVIGCADIADRFLLPAIKNLKTHYNLFGVASRSEKKSKSFSKKFVTFPFDSYDELISNPNLDAIYIPLPNSMHFEWIEKSLNKGLHVLVEKSLACNFSDVLYLNNLARKKSLVLLENFQFRFHRQFEEIRKVLIDGELGEVRCLRSSFGFPPFLDPRNIRYEKDLGGGSLLDVGAYPIKLSQLILGLNIQVSSSSLVQNNLYEVDFWGGAFLKQNNGDCFSQIAFGFDNAYQCSLEIWGSRGRLFADRIFTSPPGYSPTLEIKTADGDRLINVTPDNHFENMLKYFYKLMDDKAGREDEYESNINQSRLISELKAKASD